MITIRRTIVSGVLCLSLTTCTQLAIGQSKTDTIPGKDTAKSTLPEGVKPYREVITKNAKTEQSFFKVHTVKGRYYFEIPDAMLGRDILTVTRIEKGGLEFVVPFINLGYSGDELGKRVITFGRIPGDRLVMRSIKIIRVANDTTENGLARSLANNNLQTIEAIFPVKAYNGEGKSTVIDMTDFLNGKPMTATFAETLPLFGNIFDKAAPERSYISGIKAFPANIEVAASRTLVLNGGLGGTMDLNVSFLLLPEVPMKPRYADVRVGYFSNVYKDFDSEPYQVTRSKYIHRWRMEPKPEDVETYKRGELVEPKKPIIIYIDPATPKKWVPYLIQGVNDWSIAFEKAGFKNAIIGREAPTNDTTWSMYDARHSVIVYKPSAIPNASGPSIDDPRTGEILETHINWYHSVMTLLRNWYTIQAGAIDTAAQHAELDDELMGQLIRFVSSHEVGHTLGLKHNFGASSTVPVEKLRDKAWVEEHGHTPSIMDYARFNYVAQPEDNIGRAGIFPRIGDYDKWAIEWGYRWLPQFETAEAEKAYLGKWIVEKLASGKQYFYGSQLDPLTDEFPFNENDPRSQSEDLGDDAVLASTYGIKNLKRIKPQLSKWFRKPGENYSRIVGMYNEVLSQYNRYVVHVYNNITGMYTTPKTVDQEGVVFENVKRDKQKKAMAFLQQEFFSTPTWLIDEQLYQVSNASLTPVTRLQDQALDGFLYQVNLLLTRKAEIAGNNYPAAEILEDLRAGIFSELSAGKPVSDPYRRNLQRAYVRKIAAALVARNGEISELKLVLVTHAKKLNTVLRSAAASSQNELTREHLNGLYRHLDAALNSQPVIVVNPAPAARLATGVPGLFDNLFPQICTK
ncbi:MAG: zinc-dependent metalloprotease [Niastella sp.]|nr:zinc-dependent metalloprotease [Niastella sp.]